MRHGNGYGPAGKNPSPRGAPRPGNGIRPPVTARGREVLESSRRRGLKPDRGG
jgi:hypothetical protein